VTIVESEEDDFRSEFCRNLNRKGFKDTKWKRHYSEVVRTKVWIIIPEIHRIGSLMTKAIVRNLVYPYVRHIKGFCGG